MGFLVRDLGDNTEYEYETLPKRLISMRIWDTSDGKYHVLKMGSFLKLIGKNITFFDEPVYVADDITAKFREE